MKDKSSKKALRVAIVHDWLYGGGAELVVEQLHKLFPEAPIYTSYCTDKWRNRLDNKVVTGYLQYQPFKILRKYIAPLRILWFTGLNFKNYDLVISSSGHEAKGIMVPCGVLHVNYCHAPTHQYWNRYEEYLKHPGFGAFDWLARIGLRLSAGLLRRWDYKAAQRPNYIIANSSYTQTEIRKHYKRESTVIFPPVNFDRFQKPENKNLPRKGFLVCGRQTPYKRFDIAIQACTQLKLPLKVIGDGPDYARLKSLAGPTINFLGRVSDDELEYHFACAEALLFPGTDDFGIASVEALASGTPIIAYKKGGALDYVLEGKTGIFFEEQTFDSLCEALLKFDASSYNPEYIRSFASCFKDETFQRSILNVIENFLCIRPLA